MAQTGRIQTLSGSVIAQTPLGYTRELHTGDPVYENELIKTSPGSHITINLDNGKSIDIAENSRIILDETVTDPIDANDAIVNDVESLQKALETGEDISDAEEDTAMGEEDDDHDFRLQYHEGDQSKGQVGSYLLDVDRVPETERQDEFIPDNNDARNITATPPDDSTGVEATISLDSNITSDDIIDAAEAGETIAITGTVGGDVAAGDTVTITVDGQGFTGTVNGDEITFSVDVDGSTLAVDDTVNASVTTSTGNVNGEVTATDTESYTVDTDLPTASITLDADITADDIIDATETGEIIAITGTVGYDVVAGDTVTITVDGQEFTGTVNADGTTFSVDVDGSALAGDNTVNASVTTTTGDVNGEATATDTEGYSVVNLGAVTDQAIVNEAGLDTGTDASSNSEVVTGNLLDNDLGIDANTNITQIVSGGNSDDTVNNGLLTVDTAYGTIVVHTDNSNGQQAGYYEYTLTDSSIGDNVVETINYTIDDGTTSSTSSLDISIVDDAPIGDNIDNSIEDSDTTQTTNLIIVLDKSGSMAWDLEGNNVNDADFDPNSVRMDIAKEALSAMFDSFDNLGNVNIQFVPFSTSAEKSEWFIDDKYGANEYLDVITPNGGTHYDDALEETVDNYYPPEADKTLVYFISDGEPTNGFEADQASWESFVTNNNIDIAFGIGITDNVDLSSLEPIAFPNTNADGDVDPYTIQVLTAFDLKQTLLETVSEGVAQGDISIPTTSGEDGIVIGADGGHIQSILVDGQLHEYDPVTNQIESITTARGGTIDINYETGEYFYVINPKDTVPDDQEVFVITAVDGDGDTISVDLVIDLEYEVNLDANYDRIITNASLGDSLDVDYAALLANDAGSSNATVSDVVPDAGTELTTTPDGITLTNVADGESFNYEASSGTETDSANVDVVRTDSKTLTGTSGDDILINTKGSNDYTVDAAVRSGDTFEQNNQIGLTFAGMAGLSIVAVTFDLRAGGDTDAFFDISGTNSTAPSMGADTVGILPADVSYTAPDGSPLADESASLSVNFTQGTFTALDQFWFGVDTDYLSSGGGDVGSDFGDYGVGITVTFSDGTETSGTFITESDGSSRVVLGGQSYMYGEEGDDYLQGSEGDELLDGGEGSDTIEAGAGNDTIVFDGADAHIDGGEGSDTLLISHDVLDFSALKGDIVGNIEKFDLNDAGSQAINLTLDDVLDTTGADNVLEVTGGAGDTITFDIQGDAGDWTDSGSGLFTHANGIDQVQIVSSDDLNNEIVINYTDDGVPIG